MDYERISTIRKRDRIAIDIERIIMYSDHLFFQLLRVGLGTDHIVQLPNNNCSDINVDFAIKQGVGAFVFDGIQKAIDLKMIAPDSINRNTKMRLYAHTLQVEKACREQYTKASELSSLFAANGIRVIVLKGISAGINYPQPLHRLCGDFDCYLMGDYDKGNEIARKAGAEVGYHSYKHSHICYEGLMVENHQFCTAHRGNRQMKRFERCLQELLGKNGSNRIGDTCMECPSSLFNAIYLTHHAKEHFIFEGITLRHLCDWAMFLDKHAEEIDWQRFQTMADEYGLRKFADTMTCLSIEYLNISTPKGYDAAVSNVCIKVLEDALFEGIIKNSKTKNSFFNRINKAVRFKKNDTRLRLFSDTNFAMYVIKQIRGLLCDRNPKI